MLKAFVVTLVLVFAVGCEQQQPTAPQVGTNAALTSLAKNGTGFDEFGYNDAARIFNGTGASWSVAKGLPADYLGIYAKDKLVMKWNAEWDRGNDENWANPPYDAWEDNEWNGVGVKGGSGEVWHYKIKWVGEEGSIYYAERFVPGGYMIWGQFETIMDQGKDPSAGPGHIWLTHANPTGYGR